MKQKNWWALTQVLVCLLLPFQFSFGQERVLLHCDSSGASGSSFQEIKLKKNGPYYHLWFLPTNSKKTETLPIYFIQETPVGTYYDLGIDVKTYRRLFLVNYGKQAVILYNNDEIIWFSGNQEDSTLILEQGDNSSDDDLEASLDWSRIALVEFLTCR